MSASTSTPRDLLARAIYIKDASDEFKDDLAKLMVPIDAVDGQVFKEEGTLVKHFYFVEEGILERTKCVNGDTIDIGSIGPGHVTSLLSVASDEDIEAFSTVKAKGPAKVWSVSGDDFRAMLMSKPEHAIVFIKILSKNMRHGANTIHSLMAKLTISGGEGSDDGVKVVKVMCYDTTAWVRENFEPMVSEFNKKHSEGDGDDKMRIDMNFTNDRLDTHTATYAAGYDAVCLFVNDTADKEVIRLLGVCGVKMIAMRCAGFDRIDTKTAEAFGISVTRVPAYSPYAVAEHAIALLMSINRKIHTASTRVKMANFTLDSGLLGMDIHGKTVGVMGTGKIGQILCGIIKGFGAKILAFDVFEADAVKDMGGKYVSKDEIYAKCDVIFLMMPLLPATKHTINDQVLPKLKKGVLLINTSRGGLIDTAALTKGLQSGIIGGCGLDVYENEGDYFFQDWSARSIEDSTLVSLLGNNKVVMTAHQAFFTREAIDKIVSTTLENLENHTKGLRGKDLPNHV